MPFLGEISALVTAFLLSGTSIVFTEATILAGSVPVNLIRMISSIFFLGVTVLIFQLDVNISFMQILYLSLSGIIGLVVGDGSLLKAFEKIGPRLSMLIYALSPAMAALLAFFYLDEILSFWGIIGMFVTIFGIGIVVFQRSGNGKSRAQICWSGILFALLGALGQAVGLIFAKQAFNLGGINGFVATLFRVTGSLIILYPFAVLTGRFKSPIVKFKKEKRAFVLTITGSFFSTYLGITLSLIAIAYTYIGVAATIMATVPIILLPLSKFYYKEKLSKISIIGAFLAVGGIAI